MAPGPFLFLSDAHLGAASRAAEAARERSLLRFLRWSGEVSQHLYIMGDLFDFWFEYRSVVPRRAVPVLLALRELVEAGVGVTWMGGNHDYWLGSFLSEEMGLAVTRRPLSVEHQGRRLYLTHGDGLAGRHDRGYRLIRPVIRAPLSETLFRLLHPDLGFALARRFSKLSRSVAESEEALLDPAFSKFVCDLLAGDYDAVLTGHHHRPLHVRQGAKDWLVLGDWFMHFTYGSLQEGALSLWRWKDEGPPEPVPVEAEFPSPRPCS